MFFPNEKEETFIFEITSKTLTLPSLCMCEKMHILNPIRLLAVILGVSFVTYLRISLTLEARMVRKEKELSNILELSNQPAQKIESPLGI